MASFTRHIPHAPIKKPFSRCSLPMASPVCATWAAASSRSSSGGPASSSETCWDRPRMFTPGPLVDGKFPVWLGVMRVESEAEARDTVRSLVRRGADFIKVYDSISPGPYFALADEAKQLGMVFAGHV